MKGAFSHMYQNNSGKYKLCVLPNYNVKPGHYSKQFESMVKGKDICILGPSGDTPEPKNKLSVSIYAYSIHAPIEYISLYGGRNLEFNKDTYYCFKGRPNFKNVKNYKFINMLKFPVGHPHMLQLALHDLLYYKPKSIEVINVNFYTKKYNESFDGFDLPPIKSHAVHDPIINFYFTKILRNANLFYGDKTCEELLSLSVQEYIKIMDEIYDKHSS